MKLTVNIPSTTLAQQLKAAAQANNLRHNGHNPHPFVCNPATARRWASTLATWEL